MPSFSPVIETAAVAIAPAAIDIIGQIQKVEKRGPGSNSGKRELENSI